MSAHNRRLRPDDRRPVQGPGRRRLLRRRAAATVEPSNRLSDVHLTAARQMLSFVIQERAIRTARDVGFGWQPDPAAPDKYEVLTAAYKHSKATGDALPVSDMHCESTVYTRPAANMAFRFWHDVSHVRLGLRSSCPMSWSWPIGTSPNWRCGASDRPQRCGSCSTPIWSVRARSSPWSTASRTIRGSSQSGASGTASTSPCSPNAGGHLRRSRWPLRLPVPDGPSVRGRTASPDSRWSSPALTGRVGNIGRHPPGGRSVVAARHPDCGAHRNRRRRCLVASATQRLVSTEFVPNCCENNWLNFTVFPPQLDQFQSSL